MTINRRHFTNTNSENKAYREMFCINHTGKMEGNISISSSPALNDRCKARAACGNDKCVCTHCYANSMLEMYDALGAKLVRNTSALASEIIDWDAIPTINPERHSAARIEAFGDLNNATQAINYINLICKNSDIYFGWWTKNPDMIQGAIDAGWAIPDNVTILYSDPIINGSGANKIDAVLNEYPFIDKVFTVYDNETAAAAAGAEINCGARHCMTCNLCYSNNDTIYVNELLK